MAQNTVIVPDKGVRSCKNATGTTIDKGHIVKLDSTEGQIVLAAAATDALYGVAMADIPTGTWVDVQVQGVAEAYGTLAIGDRVTSDGSGHAAAATTKGVVLGVCLRAATTALALVDLDAHAGQIHA